jgi:hypothetical protein
MLIGEDVGDLLLPTPAVAVDHLSLDLPDIVGVQLDRARRLIDSHAPAALTALVLASQPSGSVISCSSRSERWAGR